MAFNKNWTGEDEGRGFVEEAGEIDSEVTEVGMHSRG